MKTFGHMRPVRDKDGQIIDSKPSPVKVRTLDGLSGNFGSDRNKRLVFTMKAGDLIEIRPERTARAVNIKAQDLYGYCLRCAANLETLAKARERKAKKAQRLANLRQERAEKRLTRPLDNYYHTKTV